MVARVVSSVARRTEKDPGHSFSFPDFSAYDRFEWHQSFHPQRLAGEFSRAAAGDIFSPGNFEVLGRFGKDCADN